MKGLRIIYVIPGYAEGPGYIFCKRQVDALERAGIVTKRFFLESRTSFSILLREQKRFRQLLREFKPDIVHAQYGTMTSFFTFLNASGPLVVTFRGSDLLPDYDVGRLQVGIGHLMSQYCALRASGIICVSNDLREHLWFASCRRKAEVITNGIDLSVFVTLPRAEARGLLNWSSEARVVLFNIGGAPLRKRLDLVEAAVEIARAEVPDIQLVTMNNEYAPNEVPMLMNAADCLILASEAEGSPNVIREAMACNLPIVSVDVGDVVERLREVRPSRIVARDAGALGRALVELIKMGVHSNGREIVRRELSEESMVKRIFGVYARALGRTSVELGERSENELLPYVSVIMPVFNEAPYLRRVLDSLLEQDYPGERFEVIVADGGSTDGTRGILDEIQMAHPNLKVIDNPRRIVPCALNLALAQAVGDVILRMDGHTEVAADYVRQCVAALLRTGADNVGGIVAAHGDGLFGQAVAVVMSSRFGVGGARHHYSDREEEVDTVFPGVWKKDLFDRIGLFDEEMACNEDDEFNYRLREQGGRIMVSPKIHLSYAVRTSPLSLWRQYYRYGCWKIRVLQKHPRQMQARQFVPAVFVSGLLFLLFLSFFSKLAVVWLAMVLGIYGVTIITVSANLSIRRNIFLFPVLALAFATLHFSYGVGFLVGLIKFAGYWGEKKNHGDGHV